MANIFNKFAGYFKFSDEDYEDEDYEEAEEETAASVREKEARQEKGGKKYQYSISDRRHLYRSANKERPSKWRDSF